VNLCAKCAQHELTCCQGTEVFVTDGDVRRIAAYVGKADFWEYRQPKDPVYTVHQPTDPHWLHYTVRPDGTRPQLKHQRSGDCTFLTSTGCALPAEVRPLICRLYPHDYRAWHRWYCVWLPTVPVRSRANPHRGYRNRCWGCQALACTTLLRAAGWERLV
jgi:Fe-S-cluster containining protein